MNETQVAGRTRRGRPLKADAKRYSVLVRVRADQMIAMQKAAAKHHGGNVPALVRELVMNGLKQQGVQ